VEKNLGLSGGIYELLDWLFSGLEGRMIPGSSKDTKRIELYPKGVCPSGLLIS